MRRLVWLSDTHLNVLPRRWRRRLFVNKILLNKPDCIVLTGDITTGRDVEIDLKWLSESFREQRIMFVMGNHDYHGRSFLEVNRNISQVVASHKNLTWLSESGIITLDEDTAIIGTEGWYDACLGDPSLLRWTIDWFRIEELRCIPLMSRRIEMFVDLATRSAFEIERLLVVALQSHKTVYIATHFPPWSSATTIPGTRFESFWLPYSVNTIMGKTIENVAKNFPDRKIIVLAGHTHIPNTVMITPNIECRVNRATRWGRVPDRSLIEF